ncbi:orotidine-5'-phosphate decarboxylase [Aquibacillus sediminis]|uniref:orotidine-5'-phosphate decarboxylase n=1 Tax=Aquibacillus sediminis TaxID=2574734 RepID=UPI001FE97415|nr:orotidine-5'-phosphate decarboxylase [Aquibacillus sediminis]
MKPIFLALDFPNWFQTDTFIKKHQLQGVPVKVGMELFYKEGPIVIEKLKENNHPIFLDLKLYDIPTTVKNAMCNLATLGVDVVNVHAFGGREMIHAAKEGLIQGTSQGLPPKLIAVTVLTSMDTCTLQEDLQVKSSINDTVQHLAKLTKDSGGDGVVCSVHEVPNIKDHCGTDFWTITPGIRLTNTSTNDQKRVATPGLAKEYGTDALVIGRSVTSAIDPREAYQKAEKEWLHVKKA